MILNHLNLTVTDPAAASEFLAKYFGLRPGGGNKGMQVVFDDNGLVLTLFKAREDKVKYPPTFHIGFLQPSEQHGAAGGEYEQQHVLDGQGDLSEDAAQLRQQGVDLQ